MKTLFKRTIGLLFVTLSLVSLAASGWGLIQVWRLRQPVTESALSSLDLVAQTLETTQKALDTAQSALGTVADNVASLQSALETASQALGDGVTLTDSLADLMDSDLPATLIAAQVSLAVAQSSAEAIDSVLALVTQSPLLLITPYQPQFTLSDALAGVSGGLSGLGAPLESVGGDLATTSEDLTALQASLASLAASVANLNTSLNDTRAVIGDYQAQVTTLQEKVEALRQAAPGAITVLTWGLTFALAWLMAAQIGLLTQGWGWMTGKGD